MRKPWQRTSVLGQWTSVLVLTTLFMVAGCGEKDTVKAPSKMSMDKPAYEQWEISLVEMRIEKNEEFAVTTTSPLPVSEVSGFVGLNYYFPNDELRFKTPFIATASVDTVVLSKRKGDQVAYLKRGTLRFSHAEKEYELAVFGPANSDDGNYLWLPFSDKTSGMETFAGGRYLDITLDSDGMVDLDFNYAYNPLCDYNTDKYNCTLPPTENHLGFAVVAGEKSYGVSD